MVDTWVSKPLPTGWKSSRLNLLTRMETNASRRKLNAGNSWTTCWITWKPPGFPRHLIHVRSMTWSKERIHTRLHENMGVSQLQPNLHDSQLPHQFWTLVTITAVIGTQATRKQVLILEGPRPQKQQASSILTRKWLTRHENHNHDEVD